MNLMTHLIKPRVGRPRDAEIGIRLEQLITVATQLFIDQGYGNVSLEAIAQAAHVAVRTIYVKFGGKAGLFNAVIAKERDRFLADIKNLNGDTRSLEVILTELGVYFIKVMLSPRSLSLQRIVIGEVKRFPELAPTFFDLGPSYTFKILENLFERSDIRNQFPHFLSSPYLAMHFTNCILEDYWWILFGIQEPPQQTDIPLRIKNGLSLFLYGTIGQGRNYHDRCTITQSKAFQAI